MKIKYRVAAAYTLLLSLILMLFVLQFVVNSRLQDQHIAKEDRIAAIRDAGRTAMQNMTDAETGIRGFQLTGDQAFLEPYTSGRTGAMSSYAVLQALVTDDELRRLMALERDAAADWIYAYAIPIVNAGVADTDPRRLANGKKLFDKVRTANADVTAYIDSMQKTGLAADRQDLRFAETGLALLAVFILVTGLFLALIHQRHLLQPLERIRLTLRQLADGDLSARVDRIGPGELRAVGDCVNDLASRTERLIAAEKVRAAGNELIHDVATELKSDHPLDTMGERIAGLVGAAFGAEAVYGRVTVDRGAGFAVSWPQGAPALAPAVAREIRESRRGVVLTPADAPAAIAVALDGDTDCPPGLIHVARPAGATFSDEERRLLADVAQEIDHAVRQDRLRRSQDRLIGELRTLDEQKDVFVSTVTHELRTPLTSILGYTEMLAEDEDLNPAYQRSLSAILRNAHRLQATISDLLLLDKTSEPVDAEAVPVDLAELAAGLHRDLDPAARAKDLRSEIEAQPAWVRGDGTQLKRALRYLMENAIKFTPAGGRLECRLTTDDSYVVVSISDTGIGIPAADVPGLFTPFHRATNAMDQAVQGSGLGLAIVRNIVTEHGGTVAARSELGRGSTFTMTLPALPPTHSAEPTLGRESAAVR